MRRDYIWLTTRCDEVSGVRWAAFFSFLLHCLFISILATTTIFFPPQGQFAKPEAIWFSSALLPDTIPSASSPDSGPLAEHPAVAGLDTAQESPDALSDVPVTEQGADTVSAPPLPAQEVREATGTVAPSPESEPEPEMQVAVNISAVQPLEKAPEPIKTNLTEHLLTPENHGIRREEIPAPAQIMPSTALRSNVSVATQVEPLSEQVPVREIFPVTPAITAASTKEITPEPVRNEPKPESARSLSGTTPVLSRAEVVTNVNTTQISSNSSPSMREHARRAPATLQREMGKTTIKKEVTREEAPPPMTTAHLRPPLPQQVNRETIVQTASAFTGTVPQPTQSAVRNEPVLAPTPAPQPVSTPKSPIWPGAQPEQLPAQLKPAHDETPVDKPSTKKVGSSGVFAPPLSGDLKLEISGDDDVLNRVKTMVIFRAYPRNRHTEPIKKGDYRKSVVVAPTRVRTSAHTVQEVIEIAREGIYDFRNVTDGGEAEVTFSLKIHENGSRAKIRPAGIRKTGDQGTVVKILMPEGIVWDDKKAFTGSFEDAGSITKFNTETGIVWKEYRE